MNKEEMWSIKLAARIHDPAEKALVLLRDRAGHEGGTCRQLFNKWFPDGLDSRLKKIVKKADWWASAADRPQFPKSETDGRYAKWTQVNFAKNPELVHPLSAERYDLKYLDEIDPEPLKALSFDHFDAILKLAGGDRKKAGLLHWRFGPEPSSNIKKGLGKLWSLLPADTRVPDHSIWSHLDLCSAFAGAMAADDNSCPALLSVSFGPVQSFIEQARSSSDLWAGSHLLSHITWAGMKVICEELGPDAFIFPQLRAMPVVDLWIKEQFDGRWPGEKTDWMYNKTDHNPLFSAALPNRFVALVPSGQIESLCLRIRESVKKWLHGQASAMLDLLCEKATLESSDHVKKQIEQQLEGFPDMFWSAVPWSLVEEETDKALPDQKKLQKSLNSFYPADSQCHFLSSSSWKLLAKELKIDNQLFYKPNPGVLYPALFDLLDRSMAASKSHRPFKQLIQKGYRCSLCGEREFLALKAAELEKRPGNKCQDSLWGVMALKGVSWARKGEFLCALCSLKRLWPALFMNEIKKQVPENDWKEEKRRFNRYVVSTHAMAVSSTLKRFLEGTKPVIADKLITRLKKLDESTALPSFLMDLINKKNGSDLECLKELPILLDEARESNDENQMREVEKLIKNGLNCKDVENYYAFILLDGDKMGAWLSGSEKEYQLSHGQCWHSNIESKLKFSANDSADLQQYLAEKRFSSPARHGAISESLNHFSLHLVRAVVEDLHCGKLIYAGGDDVLAMIAIDDLLSCLLALRLIYSGHGLDKRYFEKFLVKLEKKIKCRKGFVQYKNRLYRTMGTEATASAGAVIAHYSAPLARVLKELRKTEKVAKEEGGRDAFSIRVLKRSGGQVNLTASFELDKSGEATNPMRLLMATSKALGRYLSRRAAYHVQDWLRKLPSMLIKEQFSRLLKANLARQFRQQCENKEYKQKMEGLANELAELAVKQENPCHWLEEFLAVAEFLGRSERTGEKS